MGSSGAGKNLSVESVGKQCTRLLEGPQNLHHKRFWKTSGLTPVRNGWEWQRQSWFYPEGEAGVWTLLLSCFPWSHPQLLSWSLGLNSQSQLGLQPVASTQLVQDHGCAGEQCVFHVLPLSAFIVIHCPKGCTTWRGKQHSKENIPDWPPVPAVNPSAQEANSLQPSARLLISSHDQGVWVQLQD